MPWSYFQIQGHKDFSLFSSKKCYRFTSYRCVFDPFWAHFVYGPTSFLWMQVPTFHSTSCWKDCPTSIKLSWHPCQLFDQIFWLSFLGPLFYFIGPCLSLCQYHSVLIIVLWKYCLAPVLSPWLDAAHYVHTPTTVLIRHSPSGLLYNTLEVPEPDTRQPAVQPCLCLSVFPSPNYLSKCHCVLSRHQGSLHHIKHYKIIIRVITW